METIILFVFLMFVMFFIMGHYLEGFSSMFCFVFSGLLILILAIWVHPSAFKNVDNIVVYLVKGTLMGVSGYCFFGATYKIMEEIK